MTIQNNISAMRAYNRLKGNQSALSKNLQKLSSGYKVNSAADDAAGIAVSEKMRALITGMDRAEENCNEGISLLQTGEGALQEVHDMLNRLKELAVQSANGTYDDAIDRNSLQKELEQLRTEIDRIITSANFNNVELFQNEGLEFESSKGSASKLVEELMGALAELEAQTQEQVTQQSAKQLTLEDVLADKSDTLKNIIYTGTKFDYTATQTPGGTNTVTAAWQDTADILQTEIVPQVVSQITEVYPAFNYLTGSSIGIGLEMYSDQPSSTLAAVALGVAGTYDAPLLTYTLKVNMAHVGDIENDPQARSELERTIAHEMIHAFMDEAMTTGMTGLKPTGSDASQKFPLWFIEGMAQTASGPGNWTLGGLGITETSSDAEISAALAADKLGSGTTASCYGTGYLACMYLGYLANGSTANMSSPTAAANALADGVNEILADIVYGDSLNQAISEATGGRYSTVTAFENGFATDADAIAFVKKLLGYTSDVIDYDIGVGTGGLMSGSLSGTDPVPDGTKPGVNLFALDPDSSKVTNSYPAGVQVLSGGGKTASGVKPVDSIQDPDAPTPATYINPFTITGGTEGTDWEFDTDTGVLTILTNTAMTISGGTKTDNGTTYYGTIAVNGAANLTLSGVNIDATKRGDGKAGIELGNADSTINVTGNNTIKGDGASAGIQVGEWMELTLNLTGGTLTVSGDTASANGGAGIGTGYNAGSTYATITVEGSGTLNATGGKGAAGIGSGGGGSDLSSVYIMGGNITATGGAGAAGIGGGKGDDGCLHSYYGGTVTAIGGAGAAGIGSGQGGSSRDIRFYGGNVTATGGSNGAGVGSGQDGSVGGINIHNSSVVTATGGTNAIGIGSGVGGTVDSVLLDSDGAVTATSGRADGKYAIGGYTDAAGTIATTITMSDPTDTSVKAGAGEGKNITTGVVNGSGERVYALKLSYLEKLLKDGKVTITSGSGDEIVFPLDRFEAENTTGTLAWDSVQHGSEDDAYVWLTGEDFKAIFTDGDSPSGEVDLQFFADEELFRFDESDLPKDEPIVTPPSGGNGSVTPDVPQEPEELTRYSGIMLHVGASSDDTFEIPKFYLSRESLGLDALDISTQENAQDSIDLVGDMINRISEIRGTYGALQNGLEHTINNLNVNVENLTAAESQIRDTDMAEEMMKYTKNNILIQSAQAMLAQANTVPQGVLQLLQ